MLYKAALGEMALKNDRNTVLDSKFDAIRRYITEGGRFPNKMMLFEKGLTSFLTKTEWHELEGVPIVKFVILGIIFLIVLADTPKLGPNDWFKRILSDTPKLGPNDWFKLPVRMFDLSLDRPEADIKQADVK